MSQIDLNVAHIADVNIKDLADFSHLGGDQKAVIRVNHNTFRVQVLASGEVSVSFKGGFFNMFRGKTRNRLLQQIQSQVDEWKAATAPPDAGALKSVIAGNTEKALGTLFPSESGKVDAKGAEVAVYGFSDIRGEHHESAESHNIKHTMIDEYNDGIGFTPQTLVLSRFRGRLGEIRDGTCRLRKVSSGIPQEKIEAWMHFLQRPENLKKIDILGRLDEYVAIGHKPSKADRNLTGWKGEFARRGSKLALEVFVRKNLPGDYLKTPLGNGTYFHITDAHVPVLAGALNYLISQFKGMEDDAHINGCIVQAAEDAGVKITDSEMHALSDALDGVIAGAFFRQTSKLGLEFFRETKTPVMFYWTNHQGHSMPDDNRAITSKWWKYPGDSIQNHYGASITFSEMRHVQKMLSAEQDGKPFQFVKIMGLKV